MSTYYYIICEDCKERTDAASRTVGGYCHLGYSQYTLLPFIISHSNHSVRIVSEHDDEAYGDEYVSWDDINAKDMYGI